MARAQAYLLSLFLLLSLLSGCTTGGRQQAETAWQRGAYYEAEQGFRTLYRSTPKKERLLRATYAQRAGWAALRGRRPEQARQLLETSLRLQPADSLTACLLDTLRQRWGAGGSSPADTLASPYLLRPFAPLRSARSDYGVCYSADGRSLLYTSHRGRQEAGKGPSPVTGELPARIYRLSQRPDGAWASYPDSLPGLGGGTGDVGTPTLSPDGRHLYYTGVTRLADGRELPQVYGSQRDPQGRWEAGQPLALLSDSLALTAHPSLSPSGRWLFFVSDVAGGLGGKDLYVAERRGTGFGTPLPLGRDVNSPADELFPYAFSDSLVYFASDRAGGLGGLDVYEARLQSDGRWLTSALPAPLNSPADEYGFYPSPRPEVWEVGASLRLAGLLSSTRDDGAGRPHLYEVRLPAITTTIEVEVLDREGFPIPRALVRLVGKTRAHAELIATTDADGRARLEVSPAVDYVMLASASDYLNQFVRLSTDPSPESEVYSVTFYLASRVRVEQLREVYYAFDRADLLPESEGALQQLLALMKDNPEVRLEILAHADRWGRAGYNQRLSERRAQAVVDYLLARGIAPARLVSRGYGQERPFVVTRGVAARYPFLPEGQALSEAFLQSLASDEEREVADQLNRRTEFRVLE